MRTTRIRFFFVGLSICLFPTWLFAEFGEELRSLRYDDAVAGDESGYSTNIDGTIGICGAPGKHQVGADSGAAYVVDSTTGTQLMKLVPNDLEPDLLFVGNPNELPSGRAYVFDLTQF